jgi:protein-L-isoaspartate(D-aspartate) O-methyltransferase
MIGQDGERAVHIDPEGLVALVWDDDQSIDTSALFGVLDQPRTTAWSGATVGANEPFDGVWLRLTATEPGTCRIAADPAAVANGLCKPAIPSRSPALAEDRSLAYFALQRIADEGEARRWELGAVGHGPAGKRLADRLCEQIMVWSLDRNAAPAITAHPAGTPDDQLPAGFIIDKHDIRLTISF